MKTAIIFAMKITGFLLVGLCLFSGIRAGDYGRMELFQFVFGSMLFYVGNFLGHTSHT